MPKGPRALPEECVERLRAADAILHAGDFCALDVLEQLESLGPPLHAVHGNVDDPAILLRLPAVRLVKADGARIVLTHDGGPAQGRLARLRRRFPDADAVVSGHSHMPLHEQQDGFHIFNPGSPTEAPACARPHDGARHRSRRAARVRARGVRPADMKGAGREADALGKRGYPRATSDDRDGCARRGSP